MSRRSEMIASASRSSLSRSGPMALSYVALLVFNVFALYPIGLVVIAAFQPGSQTIKLAAPGASTPKFSALLEPAFLPWCAPTTGKGPG